MNNNKLEESKRTMSEYINANYGTVNRKSALLKLSKMGSVEEVNTYFKDAWEAVVSHKPLKRTEEPVKKSLCIIYNNGTNPLFMVNIDSAIIDKEIEFQKEKNGKFIIEIITTGVEN